MKVLSFPSGNKRYRIVLPARFFGTRRALYFKTKQEAELKLSEIKRFGTGALTYLADAKAKEQIKKDVDHWRYLVEKFGLTETQITQALEREVTRSKLKRATVREAIEAFDVWRKNQVANGKLSPSTLDTDRWRLLKLLRKYEHVQLADVDTVKLKEFFDGIKGSTRSIHKSVKTFFAWAFERGYLASNPMVGVKSADEFGINDDYYPIATFKRMLRVAAGLDPVDEGAEPTRAFVDLLPWFVLSGFCGLRSCEAYRLTRAADAIRWEDLKFDAEIPHVEIRGEATKRTRRKSDARSVTTAHAIEAAKAWLALVPHKGPHIVRWTKRQIQELKRDFKKATGLTFFENGFRNSFATYWLSISGLDGVGKLALEMGNSEAIAKRHYAKHIGPGSGKAWFGLRPFETVKAEVAA